MKRVTTEEAIARVRSVHGEKYDTSLVDYKGSTSKIELICQRHGSFKARLQDVTRGTGCPLCARENQSKRVSKNFRGHSGKTYNFYLGFSDFPENLEQEIMWLQLKIKAGVVKIE